jgi:hypothetical protein
VVFELEADARRVMDVLICSGVFDECPQNRGTPLGLPEGERYLWPRGGTESLQDG